MVSHKRTRLFGMSLKALMMTLAGFAIALSACNKNELPTYTQLGDLRVLALKALSDQAEVNPGTTGIVIQPVVSDVNGGGRTLTATIQTCIDPGVSYGVQPACTTPDTTTTQSFATSTLSSNGTYTGLAPTFTVNVPAAPANYAIGSSAQKYNGVSYLVFYTLTAANGAAVVSFKRILVSNSTKTAKNKNPAISSVAANGAALAATNTFSTALQSLVLGLGVNPEAYSYMNSDGTLKSMNEIYTTTWFYSDGSMQYLRTTNTDSNQWTPPSAHPTGRAAVLVVVTRDGRGGEDFQKFEMN